MADKLIRDQLGRPVGLAVALTEGTEGTEGYADHGVLMVPLVSVPEGATVDPDDVAGAPADV